MSARLFPKLLLALLVFLSCSSVSLGASVSGTVYHADGSTPILNGYMDVRLVHADTGSLGTMNEYTWGFTPVSNSSGNFSITDLDVGTYFLQIRLQHCEDNLIEEWWCADGSVHDFSAAQLLVVESESVLENINFQLDVGATISGRVTGTDDSPLDNVSVQAAIGTQCNVRGWSRDGNTGTGNDGVYTIVGLPADTYYLTTWGGGNYVDEWWTGGDGQSSFECCYAETVTVAAQASVDNIDFKLSQGMQVSGSIVKDEDNTPITGVPDLRIEILRETNNEWYDNFETIIWLNVDPVTGQFSDRIPAGTYSAKTNVHNSNLLLEWWADPFSVENPENAGFFTGSDGESIEDINFQLHPGATISGTIFHAGDSTPITGENLYVKLLKCNDACNNGWIHQVYVDHETGVFSFGGLYPGTYFLRIDNNHSNFTEPFWTVEGGSIDCNFADSIELTEGEITEEKDFFLHEGGSISGTVFQSDGLTELVGERIKIIADLVMEGHEITAGHVFINILDGTYSINGLPPGTYHIHTENDGFNDYVNEFWHINGNVYYPNQAGNLLLENVENKTSINFQLELGGSVSGKVFQEDGTTPISGHGLCVNIVSGSCDDYESSYYYGSCDLFIDGSYLIRGVPPGDYRLRTNMNNNVNFIDEWWAESASKPISECETAGVISIIAGNTLIDKNFQLNQGEIITGTVTASDGTTPLFNVCVNAYTDKCHNGHVSGDNTDENGVYRIVVPVAGNYYIFADPGCNGYLNVLQEWWNETDGSIVCENAEFVTVSVGSECVANFALDEAQTILGRVINEQGKGVANIGITAHENCGSPGMSYDQCTDAEGYYSINVPSGNYYIFVDSSNIEGDYLSGWWNGIALGSYRCDTAVVILSNSELNFTLKKGEVISGTVTAEEGMLPLLDVCIYAYTTPSYNDHVGNGSTDENGNFRLLVPTAGNYYLEAQPQCNPSLSVVAEWWNDTGGSYDCNAADSVNVISEIEKSGVDFALDDAQIISGTVTSGTNPVANVDINVSDTLCGGGFNFGSGTDATGHYSVNVPVGNYYMQVHTSNASGDFLGGWWDGDDLSSDCNDAGEIASGSTINITVQKGEIITGTVTSSNEQTALFNVCVNAYTDKCHNGHVNGDNTDETGVYRIVVPTGGNYYLYAQPQCNESLTLLEEWWNDNGGSYDCNNAGFVTVVSNQELTDIDFALDQAQTISGIVRDDLGNPVANIDVNANEICGGSGLTFGSQTDAVGYYDIEVPAGSYYFYVHTGNATGDYFGGWWNGTDLVDNDCNSAVLVPSNSQRDFVVATNKLISGTVTDNLGNPVANVCVEAHRDKCWPDGDHFYSGQTDTSGNYTISVPSGTYYLYIFTECNGNNDLYESGWWDGSSTSQICEDAVTVASDSQVNMVMQRNTLITGTITDNDATPSPLHNVCVNVYTDTCHNGHVSGTNTDENGVYRIVVPTGGNYYLYAQPQCNESLTALEEWWNDSGGSYDCNNADFVTVESNQELANVDFVLDAAHTISGTVTDEQENPLNNVCVNAYLDTCYNNHVAGTDTDENGNYTLLVPSGNYFLVTNAKCQQLHPVVDEWWDNGDGAMECAEAVALSVNDNVDNINFELVDIPDFPAPVIQTAGLITRVKADSSESTIFYLFLSGSSPDDIFSCVAEGPSGVFNLSPDFLSDRRRGNIHVAVPNYFVDNGTYTFTVTDVKGRQVTASQEFTLVDSLPKVVEESRLPTHESYVATTTPTLSFDSVGAGYYYKVYVIDYEGKAFWYASEVTQDTSYTVPEGLLQPNTPYKWYVRVFDRGGLPNSCQESELFSFYTGEDSSPSIEDELVVDINQPGFQGTWFSMRNANVAPWDVVARTVTDPDNNSYDIGGYFFRFNLPVSYSLVKPVSTTFADGEYTFNLTKNGGTSASGLVYYTKNSLPFLDESSFSPAPNTYFASDSLDFSWDPLSDSGQPDRDYYYRLRVYSYDKKMIWYDSELMKNKTSISIPVSGNVAVGTSYYWRVLVYDDGLQPNNVTSSSYRVFTVADAPVVADFTATPCSGTGSLNVSFSDQSKGNIASWHWDFGDGLTSTLNNPTHNYAGPGNYSVTLRVDGFYGGTNTKVKYQYVVVATPDTPPVARFSATPVSGIEPLSVSFANNSTGDISSWLWDFGDGGTSNVAQPSHTFTAADLYTVSLTVTGNGGSNVERKVDFIEVSESAASPVVKFSATPLSGTNPCNVIFTNQTSGNVDTWLWDFGDGETSTLYEPQHIYDEAGVYAVTLTAVGEGGSNTVTKPAYVSITEPAAPPLARFSASSNIGTVPLNVTFMDESTGEVTAWSWAFGDGGVSNEPSPVHIYSVSGNYSVTLTATGPGGSNTVVKTDYVVVSPVGEPPVAKFSATPLSGSVQPHNVVFSDESTGQIETWSWNFGDGSEASSARNPVHVYTGAGTYNVSLTITGPGDPGNSILLKNNYVVIEVDDIPPLAVVSNPPLPLTNNNDFSLHIGGLEVEQYSYRLDASAWSEAVDVGLDCNLSELSDGQHVFEVVGCDAAGNWQLTVDATRHVWMIDRTPPTADLSGAPQGTVAADSPQVSVGGQGVVFYRWKLDSGSWSNAVSVDNAIAIVGLSDGSHQLQVIGCDKLGNWQADVDATEAAWSVDSSEPTAVLSGLPKLKSEENSASISVSGDEVVAYKYRLSGPAAAYDGNWSGEIEVSAAITFNVSADGSNDGLYELEVVGKNNLETWQGFSSATAFSWVVDITPPAANNDLSADLDLPTTSAVVLNWQPLENSLKQYLVRYSAGTWTDWDSAVSVHCDLVPGSAGNEYRELFRIDGLQSNSNYYFAVKSVDEVGNVSLVSNIKNIATAANPPDIDAFVLLDGEGVSGDNSINRRLQVGGSSFLPGPANKVRFVNDDNLFECLSQTANSTSLIVSIPSGAPVGDYQLRVINNNGISARSDTLYSVVEAPKPVPEVVNVIPPVVPVGGDEAFTINIEGRNFIDGETLAGTVTLLSEAGLEIPLAFTVLSDNMIEAVVSVTAPVGVYNVKVTLIDRFNAGSSVQLEIYQPLLLAEAGGTVETSGGVAMPGSGSNEGVVAVAVTLTTEDADLSTTAVADDEMEIAASIDPGTTISVDGVPYIGTIDPPRQIPVSPAVAAELGDDALVFTIGNSEETLVLGDNQTIMVTLEVVLSSALPLPVIHYLEADGSLTVAGVDGDKDAISYVTGGTILSSRIDTPEAGQTTYIIGLLLNHMSTYTVSTTSVTDVYVYTDDGSTRKGPHCETIKGGYSMLGESGGNLWIDTDEFFEGDLLFDNLGKNIFFSGGWDQEFANNNDGTSKVVGSLTISGGCITIENIAIVGQ